MTLDWYPAKIGITMPKNYEARQKKLDRRRNGMRKAGYSLLTVIVPMIQKRGDEAKAKQEKWAKEKREHTRRP